MKLTSEYFEGIKPSKRALSARKPIYGVGINDAPFITNCKLGGKLYSHPAYVAWKNILTRAFDQSYAARFPTYQGVMVCDEWVRFSVFLEWWRANHRDGWQLDKDLLGNSKIYSPDNCIYVPSWLNSFNTDRAALRGKWPIGVRLHKEPNTFESRCRNPITRKSIHLGLFDSPVDAHYAWVECKTNLAIELRPQMDRIHPGLFHGVMKAIKEAI